MTKLRVSNTTALAISAERMWHEATSLDGVNHELGPWLRMTHPRGMRGATIADLEPGVGVGKSWVFLLWVLPIDYDDLCVTEIEAPRRFQERSTMASMRVWEHERIIEPRGPGACSLTDNLAFTLRRPMSAIPGSASFARAIVGFLFRHRHRRLVAAHGAADVA